MAACTNFTLVLTGCESTGKTTLATQLASHFDVPLVPEVARLMMSPGEPYGEKLVLEIAKQQNKAEVNLRRKTPGLLIADTDLSVIYIWCQNKFGHVDPWLVRQFQQQSERQYLLMSPDLTWVEDPLRESQTEIPGLHKQYQTLLKRHDLRFEKIHGEGQSRFNKALSFVEKWMLSDNGG